MSLREQILAADDLRRQPVVVDVWGCRVNVCSLTAAGRTRVRELRKLAVAERRGPEDDEDDEGELDAELAYAQLLVYSLRDDAGDLIFTEDDIPALAESKNAQVVKELFDIAMPLCGFGSEGVEALAKKCSAAPSSSSPTG